VRKADKDLVWLHGTISSPPFSAEARIEAGVLLRRLQQGEKLALPHSRPMPAIRPGCHELRIQDRDVTWRIFHYIDVDAVVLLEITNKKTRKTPKSELEVCRARLARYKAVG
jgi:phage-related protein